MRRYALYAMSLGLLGILFCWSSLWCVEIVRDAFAIGTLMGLCTLGGFILLAGGFGYLLLHEIRGYVAIRSVDRLAHALQFDDLAMAQKYASRWLCTLDQFERVVLVERANSIHEILNILQPVIEKIDGKVDGIIAKESLLTGAVVGISPWPLLDGFIVAWRQLRLMRGIARQYGLRPSTAGTLRLCKSVVISVAFADASEHVMQWISAKIPSVGGLLPSAGQALATAVLTARLGRSCKSACRPCKLVATPSRSVFAKVKRYFKKTTPKAKSTRCGLSVTQNSHTPCTPELCVPSSRRAR